MVTDAVYAALEDHLLIVSPDNEWSRTERLQGLNVEAVAASAERPERAFAGTRAAGILRTTDGGDSWEQVSGIKDRITALAVPAKHPNVVWTGTEPSAVYRSGDGGDNWEQLAPLTELPSEAEWSFPPRPDTHHVRWIEPDPQDPDRLSVAIEAGAVVRTVDGGETWLDHPAGAPRDAHTLGTHPDAVCRVYAAAGNGFFRSDDRGETWSTHTTGLDHRYVWGLAVPRSDPDTVVVSAADDPQRAHAVETAESYVYRSTDRGVTTRSDDGDVADDDPGESTWTVAMDGLPDPDGTVRSLLATAGGARLYALNNRGLFRTENAGATWQRVPVEWPAAYETQTPRALAVV